MRSGGSQPGVAEVLAALATAMRRCRLAWYVFGAQAVLAYGRPRTTSDVDATVALGDCPIQKLLDALARVGIELRIPRFEEFVAQARVLPLVHRASGLELDLVLAGPGIEEDFLARARKVDFAGVVAPTISPEDLAATKILANRPKDIEDVRGILAVMGPALDLAGTRAVLEAFEEALGQSDLVVLFERLVEEARRPAPSPRRRRGSRT